MELLFGYSCLWDSQRWVSHDLNNRAVIEQLSCDCSLHGLWNIPDIWVLRISKPGKRVLKWLHSVDQVSPHLTVGSVVCPVHKRTGNKMKVYQCFRVPTSEKRESAVHTSNGRIEGSQSCYLCVPSCVSVRAGTLSQAAFGHSGL